MNQTNNNKDKKDDFKKYSDKLITIVQTTKKSGYSLFSKSKFFNSGDESSEQKDVNNDDKNSKQNGNKKDKKDKFYFSKNSTSFLEWYGTFLEKWKSGSNINNKWYQKLWNKIFNIYYYNKESGTIRLNFWTILMPLFASVLLGGGLVLGIVNSTSTAEIITSSTFLAICVIIPIAGMLILRFWFYDIKRSIERIVKDLVKKSKSKQILITFDDFDGSLLNDDNFKFFIECIFKNRKKLLKNKGEGKVDDNRIFNIQFIINSNDSNNRYSIEEKLFYYLVKIFKEDKQQNENIINNTSSDNENKLDESKQQNENIKNNTSSDNEKESNKIKVDEKIDNYINFINFNDKDKNDFSKKVYLLRIINCLSKYNFLFYDSMIFHNTINSSYKKEDYHKDVMEMLATFLKNRNAFLAYDEKALGLDTSWENFINSTNKIKTNAYELIYETYNYVVNSASKDLNFKEFNTLINEMEYAFDKLEEANIIQYIFPTQVICLLLIKIKIPELFAEINKFYDYTSKKNNIFNDLKLDLSKYIAKDSYQQEVNENNSDFDPKYQKIANLILENKQLILDFGGFDCVFWNVRIHRKHMVPKYWEYPNYLDISDYYPLFIGGDLKNDLYWDSNKVIKKWYGNMNNKLEYTDSNDNKSITTNLNEEINDTKEKIKIAIDLTNELNPCGSNLEKYWFNNGALDLFLYNDLYFDKDTSIEIKRMYIFKNIVNMFWQFVLFKLEEKNEVTFDIIDNFLEEIKDIYMNRNNSKINELFVGLKQLKCIQNNNVFSGCIKINDLYNLLINKHKNYSSGNHKLMNLDEKSNYWEDEFFSEIINSLKKKKDTLKNKKEKEQYQKEKELLEQEKVKFYLYSIILLNDKIFGILESIKNNKDGLPNSKLLLNDKNNFKNLIKYLVLSFKSNYDNFLIESDEPSDNNSSNKWPKHYSTMRNIWNVLDNQKEKRVIVTDYDWIYIKLFSSLINNLFIGLIDNKNLPIDELLEEPIFTNNKQKNNYENEFNKLYLYYLFIMSFNYFKCSYKLLSNIYKDGNIKFFDLEIDKKFNYDNYEELIKKSFVKRIDDVCKNFVNYIVSNKSINNIEELTDYRNRILYYWIFENYESEKNNITKFCKRLSMDETEFYNNLFISNFCVTKSVMAVLLLENKLLYLYDNSYRNSNNKRKALNKIEQIINDQNKNCMNTTDPSKKTIKEYLEALVDEFNVTKEISNSNKSKLDNYKGVLSWNYKEKYELFILDDFVNLNYENNKIVSFSNSFRHKRDFKYIDIYYDIISNKASNQKNKKSK